jgi:hypothetical protein
MPRNSGTCTRVPFHVVTKTSNSPWTCTISLEKDHVFDPNHSTWRPLKETISHHFTTITDPGTLEEWLRRAQAAMLNPSQNHDSFKTCDLEETDHLAVQFSPCQVRINISSSDVADLAFYDLPGIIASSVHDGIDLDLPDFIRKLVTGYVNASNNIILLVMPMNNDCENCSAFAIVKKLRATDRTVGIFTKPDLIDQHAPYKDWIAMLDGKRQPLGHGYYVVKNPNQQELNMHVSRAVALQRETQFFNTSTPWSTDFSRFRHHFGSSRIQEKLSTLLVSEIRRTLPLIAVKLQQKLQAVLNELNYRPKPAGPKSLTIVMDLLNQISATLSDTLRGTYPRTECVNGIHRLVKQLRSDLSASKPQLKVIKQGAIATASRAMDTIDLCDSEDDVPTTSLSKKRPTSSSSTSTSPKKQKTSNGVIIKRDPSETSSLSSTSQTTAQAFTVADLKDLMRRIDVTGFRGALDPRAVTALTTPALEMWNQPTSRFLTAVGELLEAQMSMTFQEHLQEWNSSPIATRLPQEARTMSHKVISDVTQDAIRALHAEQTTPMIVIDDEAVETAKNKELAKLAASQRKILLKRHFDSLDKQTGKTISPIDRAARGAKLSDEELPSDTASAELNLLATANAYLSVSIEHLVFHLTKQVLYAFDQVRHPQSGLIAQLKVQWLEEGGLEMCQNLLEVNEAQARERVKLEAQKRKLLEAQKALGEVMAVNAVAEHGGAIAHR